MRLEDVPAVPGVTHREVHTGEVRLHVAEAGQGEPLLLLHGWPQHWWSWRRLIPALSGEYRVIAPDLRGWGWSEAPPGDYAKSVFAADVLALLEAEGIDRVRIVGHDWGGYAAFLLALDHPERVERFVALDIPPPGMVRPRPRHAALPLFFSYQALLATPVVGERTLTAGNGFIRRLIRLGSGSGMTWTDAELDIYAGVLREPARARATSACYRTFLTRELVASVRGSSRDLEVPALLVMGGDSILRRIVAPEPRRNLRVESIPGAGHFLPEEAPDEVLELARPFLAKGVRLQPDPS